MSKSLFTCSGCEVVTKKVTTCDCCSTYSCELCIYGESDCGNHSLVCANCYPCCLKCVMCNTMKDSETSVMCDGRNCVKYICLDCQVLHLGPDGKMFCHDCYIDDFVFPRLEDAHTDYLDQFMK